MAGRQGWAVGLAVFSVLFAMGWSWLRKTQSDNQDRSALKRQGVGRIVQIFYFVGIPYAAIVSGTLPPRLLGLKGVEYFALIDFQAGAAAAQIQYTIVLVLLEWFVDAGVSLAAGLAALVVLGGVWISLARVRVGETTVFQWSVLDTIYHSLHWAFYWAIFWGLTGDLYLGVVLGTGFVILEWILIVQMHQEWESQQQTLLVNIFILILTGAIFFYSPNLWLLWPIHLLMVVLIKKLDRTRRKAYMLEPEHLLSSSFLL